MGTLVSAIPGGMGSQTVLLLLLSALDTLFLLPQGKGGPCFLVVVLL